MKLISIMTACYNEEENVEQLYQSVKDIFTELKNYNYEHIFIDNASEDRTVDILKKIAAKDKNVKIIVNIKNFGHIRSPYHAILQAKGDAVISMVADFQEPPEIIKEFIKKWEEGSKIVVGVKTNSEENRLMFAVRKLYYNLLKKVSQTDQIVNFTGFGLYDRSFIDILRQLEEPYPYFRGLIAELGCKIAEVKYFQPERKQGKTKNNFYTLYDMAMTGFINYSKIPIRMATFFGFVMATISFFVALIYFILKITLWERFYLGIAPIVIGFFIFSSIQLIFLGIIGEYISAIFTHVKNRPLVIEKERINYD